MKYFPIYFLLFITTYSNAQEYTDYLGAGHDTGIIVTSSNQQSRTDWTEVAAAENTLNGQGMDARLLETSRFLAQATFGTDLAYIKTVSEGTFEEWIDAQFLLPETPVSMGDLTNDIYDEAKDLYYANGGEGSYSGPSYVHYTYAWWQTNMNNDDLLRQRVALALSEILVISSALDFQSHSGEGMGYYYDILLDNAFGNYKDIITGVSLHPMMGRYLTHYSNPKSDLATNRFPDENYAREVMQLFTIGLDELNQDGSYVLDGTDRIPTYGTDDVKEFAKIFTGLSAGASNISGVTPSFNLDFRLADLSVPMAMYDAEHETGVKNLLNGYTVPSGQTGMEDVNDAIDHLFNHPNVGPFIAKRLIQRLVKSNPSPQYIAAVSAAFNNTNGVRGDMKGIIKAILLHDEARSCGAVNNPNQGKMREPMINYYNLVRQIGLSNPSGYDWNLSDNFFNRTAHRVLSSYSVFSFYLPSFSPNGPISDAGLVGPEYQIHDSNTSIGFINAMNAYTSNQAAVYDGVSHLGISDSTLDMVYLQYLAKDSEVLINHLDKLLTHGLLSNDTRQIIKTALANFSGTDTAGQLDRAKMALYLIMNSPDYAILK